MDFGTDSLPYALTIAALTTAFVAAIVWRRRHRTAPATLHAPDRAVPTVRVSSTETAEPLVHARPLGPTSLPARTRRPAPPAVTAQVHHLSDLLTGGAQAANLATTRAWRLVFSPHLQAGLTSGAYTLLESGDGTLAIVADASSGQIVGHGRLVSRAIPTSVAAAAWQVAAMVTAQKYLAVLDARLRALEVGLARVQDWLEDEQHARMARAHEDVSSWLETLASTEPNETDRALAASRLDRVEGDTTEVMRLMERQLDRLADEVGGSVAATWTTGSMQAAAEGMVEHANRRTRLATLWRDAAVLRAGAVALRPTVGRDAEHARMELVRMWAGLRTFGGDRLTTLDDRLAEESQALSATFGWQSTIDDTRRTVLERLQADPVTGFLDQGIDTVAALVVAARSDAAPLTLDVELDDRGDIAHVWLIDDAQAEASRA